MFRFAHSEYLYLLYTLPVLILLFWYYQYKKGKMLKKFAQNKMHKVLFPMRSKIKSSLKFGMVLFSIILIIFALANPQFGSKIEEVKQVGIDVYILLDVSLSMTAQDIKPSRLAKAKYEIAQLIQKLRGDRIGLIVFAGDAFIQFPLTSDYSAANLFLNAVSTHSVPEPGTAIAPAIELAVKSFKKDTKSEKAIVLITDGEDHQGDLKQAVNDAVKKGILIYAIGMGSPNGVPIPIFDASGHQIGYKKDRQGNVVLTKLDEATLKEITSLGGGKYYHASNSENELQKIYNDLSKLKKTQYGSTKITDYVNRFYYLLIPAIIFLILEFFISERRTKLLMKFDK